MEESTSRGQGVVVDQHREFETFCQEAYPRLVAALHAMTGDAGLAEELAQEGLERAYARWGHVRRMQNPAGWTFTVAANLARSRIRRLRAERRARSRLGPPAHARSDPDVAGGLAVREALARLNEAQRRVVVLRHVLQFTPDEIAAVTGTSAGAVRTMTSRAMQRLRDDLANDQETVDDRH